MSERLHLSPNQRAWRRFLRNRGAAAALAVLLALIALVLFWPLCRLAPAANVLPKAMTHPPDAVSDAQFAPPTWEHWFGTDAHGRDLLSRVCHGSRISLLVGLVGATVSLVIGVLWGAVAGYSGGRLDGVMMRFCRCALCHADGCFCDRSDHGLECRTGEMAGWPHGISAENARLLQFAGLFVGLGAVSWLTMARIVRGQVLSMRQRPFIDASLVLGASHARIIWRHILPNVYGIIIVYLTLLVPSIILYESF